MEVRCKSFSASTFALLFSNEKWKVENGKILSPLLVERIEHSTQSVVSVLGEGTSRREKSNKAPLLWGGRSCACTSKLQMRGGGSSRRVKLNLLLLAVEGWDEVEACCLFITPPAIVVRYTHTIASSPSKEEFVACRDKVNILHDICKNFPFSIFNFPFITEYGGFAHA